MQDGTLLHLGIKPEHDDAADYHGKKFTYSLTINVNPSISQLSFYVFLLITDGFSFDFLAEPSRWEFVLLPLTEAWFLVLSLSLLSS